mgnify:CR=1 FL=1
MFGANGFGQPYFAQAYTLDAQAPPNPPVTITVPTQWRLHRFDLKPRQEERG